MVFDVERGSDGSEDSSSSLAPSNLFLMVRYLCVLVGASVRPDAAVLVHVRAGHERSSDQEAQDVEEHTVTSLL